MNLNLKEERCKRCVADKDLCERCKDNPKYADYPLYSYFQAYIPVCPQGWDDCVYDPAYIKHHYPDWYKELYRNMTPKEAAKKSCNENDKYCYDDEDK